MSRETTVASDDSARVCALTISSIVQVNACQDIGLFPSRNDLEIDRIRSNAIIPEIHALEVMFYVQPDVPVASAAFVL